MSEITELLAVQEGRERPDLAAVFERLYADLKRIAIARVSALGPDETLSATGLVHEAYLKLVGAERLSLSNRKHFFACAARAMRQILIDHARHRGRGKRGSNVPHLDLDRVELASDGPAIEDILTLDRALERLAELDPELVRLVEWRFFAGLNLGEIAELSGLSERTLKRDWQVARAFLLREIAGGAMGPAAQP